MELRFLPICKKGVKQHERNPNGATLQGAGARG